MKNSWIKKYWYKFWFWSWMSSLFWQSICHHRCKLNAGGKMKMSLIKAREDNKKLTNEVNLYLHFISHFSLSLSVSCSLHNSMCGYVATWRSGEEPLDGATKLWLTKSVFEGQLHHMNGATHCRIKKNILHKVYIKATYKVLMHVFCTIPFIFKIQNLHVCLHSFVLNTHVVVATGSTLRKQRKTFMMKSFPWDTLDHIFPWQKDHFTSMSFFLFLSLQKSKIRHLLLVTTAWKWKSWETVEHLWEGLWEKQQRSLSPKCKVRSTRCKIIK